MAENMTSKMSELPAVGLPAGAPERPETPTVYPAVHDLPAQRPAPLLNETQREQLEAELVSARDRQQAATGTAPPKEPAKKKAAPARPDSSRTVPAPSSGTIY